MTCPDSQIMSKRRAVADNTGCLFIRQVFKPVVILHVQYLLMLPFPRADAILSMSGDTTLDTVNSIPNLKIEAT